MKNPWLEIPLADYEGHMALPYVDQARMLAEAFESLLREYRPASVAVIGCAGGNGFERISPVQTKRVVGLDLNPEYITAARNRFNGFFESLELIAGDVQGAAVAFAPVQLIFAGLVFEYVNPPLVLANLRAGLTPDGVLAVLLQLPSPGKAEVTPSPFDSLKGLSPIMRLVPPADLTRHASGAGLSLLWTRQLDLPSGKTFRLLAFTAAAPT